MVAVTCADPSLFDLATDDDLWQKADQLEAARPAARAKLSTSLGLNYVLQGFYFASPCAASSARPAVLRTMPCT